jgi:hypothetical protein
VKEMKDIKLISLVFRLETDNEMDVIKNIKKYVVDNFPAFNFDYHVKSLLNRKKFEYEE